MDVGIAGTNGTRRHPLLGSATPLSVREFTDNGAGSAAAAAPPFVAAERPFVGQDEPVTAFRLPVPRDRRSVSTTLNVGELLNLVGLSTGVVLYAMLLAMVVRAARTPGLKSGFDPLLLLTSLLGLVWNLCALPAYELPKMGIEGPFPYLAAVGFAALGFLPAVVVHSVLQRRASSRCAARRSARSLAIAYAVSAIAAVLHVARRLDGCASPVAARHAAADLHVRRARRPAGGGHARTAGRGARAVGRGAGDLRGLRACT